MAQHQINDRAKEMESVTRTEVIATVLAAGWMAGVGLFLWFAPQPSQPQQGFDGLRLILMLIAVFMPVAMIWVAVAAARSARIMREESFRVQAAIDGMRQMYIAEKASKPDPAPKPPAAPEPAPLQEPALETQAASAAEPDAVPETKPEPTKTRFTSRREVSKLIVPQPAPQMPSDQPTLALGAAPEDFDPPLARPDLIRALNFPDNENDKDGFAALRRALRDRTARKLVQASQDVLTLLSQDGIYMDDLKPAPPRAGLWRRFAHGERGRSMDQLGSVRDQVPIMLATGRMREDTIFRDAVHHFLRRFDQMLVTFEEHATDTDLIELAETRTARAFMLMGRVTGTFD